jgi:hypothetical protein
MQFIFVNKRRARPSWMADPYRIMADPAPRYSWKQQASDLI